jgi:type IV pilus assembly protein PilM
MATLQEMLQPYIDMVKKGLQRTSRIGLDITSDTIVAVELKKVRNSLVLQNIAVANTPLNTVQDGEVVDPAAVSEVIAELLAEYFLQGKRAVCAVACHSPIVRPVRFPMMPESELAEVISFEAERYIPFAIDDVNISHHVLDEVEEDGAVKQEVILVAAQKALVNSLLRTVTDAGLTLEVVDVASFAVLRALADTEQVMDGQSIGLIHIQGWTTDINILVSGVPRFSRSIPIGYSYFLDAILNAMGLEEDAARQILDDIDVDPQGAATASPQVEQATEIIRPALAELTAEVGRSLDFYLSQGTDPIDRVIISGRGGNLKSLDRFLTSRLGLPVELANPFAKIEVDEDQFDPDLLYPQAPTLATAIGLAIRGVQGL